MRQDILHYYRQARAHQMATYGYNLERAYGATRWEKVFSGGGAAPGFHASAAYNDARRSIHSRKWLSEQVKDHKKRSRAAKRGWETRKQEQST